MLRKSLPLVCVLGLQLPVFSQEAIFGIFPEPSRILSAIAPGSVVLVYSSDRPIGPAGRVERNEFPLATNLAGTSVRIESGDVTAHAYVLAAESHWARVLIPSWIPPGSARLFVSYLGIETGPYRLELVERSIYLYDGSWCTPSSFAHPPAVCPPRTVEQFDAPGSSRSENGFLNPARPGQQVILRGTGLGAPPPADGDDESAAPLRGAFDPATVRVTVGGRPVAVLSAHRAECCPGVDEIVFEVPSTFTGCSVPVGAGSNVVNIAVALPGASACSDPLGLTEAEVKRLAGGTLSAAAFLVAPHPNFGNWSAAFASVDHPWLPAMGSCQPYTWGLGPWSFDISRDRTRDVGPALTLRGPGISAEARRQDNQFYYGALEPPLPPGVYTIESGGGRDTPFFRAAVTLGSRDLTWTNPDDVSFSTLAQGLTVEWRSGDPDSSVVWITGSYSIDGEHCGGCRFICVERASAGRFAIPPFPAPGSFNEATVSLYQRTVKRLSIPGFDLAELALVSDEVSKRVEGP